MSHDGYGPDGCSGHHDGHGLDSYGLGHFDGHGDLAPHMCFHTFDQGDAGHATAEAVVISHCFGDSAYGHNNGTFGHADTNFNHSVGHNGDGPTNTQAKDPGKQGFAIVVVGHDYLDTFEILEQYLLDHKATGYTARQGIPRRSKNLYQTLNPIKEKTSTQAAIMPDGYFPGASGLTTEYRSFWQIGSRGLLDKIAGRPSKLNPKTRTYLEVSGTQWFYGTTGDYETRLYVRVVSSAVYNRFLESYCFRKGELNSHLELAQNLANHLLEKLRAAKPSERVLARRKQLR